MWPQGRGFDPRQRLTFFFDALQRSPDTTHPHLSDDGRYENTTTVRRQKTYHVLKYQEEVQTSFLAPLTYRCLAILSISRFIIVIYSLFVFRLFL